MGNTYNRVYIWCCKYGENRYCERCANKKLCASKHTGLLNSCLGKLCLHPYLAVPLISARVTLISTRVSAHCQTILLIHSMWWPMNELVWKVSQNNWSHHQVEIMKGSVTLSVPNLAQSYFILSYFVPEYFGRIKVNTTLSDALAPYFTRLTSH